MSRRRPRSFAHWAAGVVGAVITALIMYQLRIYKAEYRSEHLLFSTQRQLQQNPSLESPNAHQPSLDEIAALRETAQRQAELDRKAASEHAEATALEQLKENAWRKYFIPTQRCQIPESQRMVEVCQANEAKRRAKFEADWAADKRI